MSGAIIIPAVITILVNNGVLANKPELKSGYIVKFEDGDKLDVEEFIPLVVMKQVEEINDENNEAIKALIVIDRTRIMKRLNDKCINAKDLNMEYESKDIIKNERGKKYDKYREIKLLLKETNLNIITYKGETINAYTHKVSAGKTRNCVEEYLVSADSMEDIRSEQYLDIKYYTPQEFNELIKNEFGIDIGIENQIDKIHLTAQNENGYVEEVIIGDESNVYSGDEFSKKLKLKSQCFSVEKYNETIRIITKGVGNGKGMSIYGAEQMSGKGRGYKEIIMHYFKGVKIDSIKKIKKMTPSES